jgi:hypothetical protein
LRRFTSNPAINKTRIDSCNFVKGIMQRKMRGAIAVIVVNSEPNNIIMSGADATIMIPQLASVAAL